jgi:hypothetical protein
VKSTVALIPPARAGAYDASEEEESGLYSILGREGRNCNGHRSIGKEEEGTHRRRAGVCLGHRNRIAPGRRRPGPYSRRTGGRQNGSGRSGNGFARFSVKRLSTKFYLFDTKKSDFL